MIPQTELDRRGKIDRTWQQPRSKVPIQTFSLAYFALKVNLSFLKKCRLKRPFGRRANMATVMAQQQVPHTDYIRQLQQFLYNIFIPIIQPSHAQVILSEKAMRDYWIPCFTHKSLSEINNEDFEHAGDEDLAAQFNKYLRRRFGRRMTPAQGTYFQNNYMSKEYQAEITERLGLAQFVRHDPTVEEVTKDIKEDIFEAVGGTLVEIFDEMVADGLGGIMLFNFLTLIFQNVPLSLEEVARDFKSQLKEIYDKKKWGTPAYNVERSDRPDLGVAKVVIRSQTGSILGIGYGPEKRAENQAAEEALRTLAAQGVTRESADQEQLARKRRQNPEFEKQFRRTQIALQRFNQQAAASGRQQAIEVKTTSAGNTKSGSTTSYTYSLDLAFRNPDGRISWKPVAHQSASDQNAAQIAVMKQFADNFQVEQ
jgi:dsRNA-specific ribonuclease